MPQGNVHSDRFKSGLLRFCAIVFLSFALLFGAANRPVYAFFGCDDLEEECGGQVHDLSQTLEWLKEFYENYLEWIIKTFQQAFSTAVRYATSRAAIETNLRGYQSEIDMQHRMSMMKANTEIALRYHYLSGNKLCPLIAATATLNELEDAKQAVSDALASTMRWAGISGDNPNSLIAAFKLMCDMNLMGLSQTKGLFRSYCQQTTSDYSGASMNANAVVGPFEYIFPSNLKKLKDGRMSFDKPVADDMPGLAAIMFCGLMHTSTGAPVASDTQDKATASNIVTFMSQVRHQLISDTAGDVCMDALTDRIAVPASVQMSELKRVHDNQETFCLHAMKSGCMSEQDYNRCQTYGMSPLNIRRHIACRYSIPSCSVDGLIKRGFDQQFVTRTIIDGKQACGEFYHAVNEDRKLFIEGIKRAARRVDVVEQGLTDRPSQ